MSMLALSMVRGFVSVALTAVLFGGCHAGPATPGGGSGGAAAGTAGASGGEAGNAADGGADSGAGAGDSGAAGDASGRGGSGGAGAAGATGGGAGARGAGGAGGAGGIGGTGGVQPPAPPLVLDVSTTVNPVAPGGRVLYTVTVGNTSNHAVDGVAVSLLLPVGLQFHYIYDSEPNSSACAGLATCSANGQATWTLGSLAAGASRTISLNAAVLMTVGDGDSIATAFKLGATGINDIIVTKTLQVHAQSSAQLSTGTVSYPLRPGQHFTLDLDVGQLGGTALTGASLQASLAPGLTVVAISDGGAQAPSGVISWAIGGLGVGAALHRTIDIAVDANLAAGTVLGTRATLMYDGGLDVDAVAEYAVVIAPAAPLLSVSVAATPTPVDPNGRLTYTVTVGNLAARAVDGIFVQLRVPPGLQYHYIYATEPNSSACAGLATCSGNLESTWTIGTLAAGASETIVVNPAVLANVVGNGNLIRTLFAVTGTGVGEIDVVKTVQVHDSPAAQLSLTPTANPVTSNQAFTYNLDIGQIGVSALAGAELRARLPPGLTVGAISDGGTQAASGEIVWTIGAVPVGADLRRTVAVTGDGSAAPGTVLPARASLTFDGGPAVDALTEHDVSVISAAQPLTFTLAASPSPAVPGNRLLYTATVTNTSARSLDAVVVGLRVPEGVQFHYINDADPNSLACAGLATCSADLEAFWNLGTIAAGGNQIITVNAQVLTGLLGGSLIAAPFTVTSTGITDPILLDVVVPAHQ